VSTACQQACLDAYIAIGDAPLNKALARSSRSFGAFNTPLGVADPPTVSASASSSRRGSRSGK
jgi:hypothetical protein